MTLHRRIAAIAAVGAVTLSLTSCAESKRDEGTGSGTTAGAGGGTFTFGAAGAPKLFDPFYATDGETFRVTRQMYEGLLDMKPGTAEVTEGLATKWEQSNAGRTWTFTLREGVKFHDGEALDAEAVCANFNRWYSQTGDGQSPSVASYWAENFGGFKGQKGEDGKPVESLYKSCTVKDDMTAVVDITRATSKFPTLLAHSAFALSSPKALEEHKANEVKAQGEGFVYPEYATKHPTGTGPFKFESYDEANKTVTLVRNDDYWGEKAKVEKVVFKIIPDESTRKQELLAGSIDGYDLPNPVDWQSLKDKKMNVEVRDAFNLLYLGFNPKGNPALKDLKVRQAIAHAINREGLVKTQLPEGASVATQFMPDTVQGYNADLSPISYSTDEAKKLLKEAGQENLTLDLWYPSEVTRPYMPDPQRLHDAIRKDLEAAGIKVEVTTKPWNGGYLDQVDTGKADAFLLGWTGDYDSADNFIGTFFGTTNNRFGTGGYDWGKQLSADLKKADSTVDEGERTKAYEELNKQIVEDYLPAVPLTHSPPAIVVSDKVQGLVTSPLTAESFDTVTVSK